MTAVNAIYNSVLNKNFVSTFPNANFESLKLYLLISKMSKNKIASLIGNAKKGKKPTTISKI